MEVTVGPLQVDELGEADRIFRLAFGTLQGLPDPMKFGGDAALIRTRFTARNTFALTAQVDGEMAGLAFGANWGSVGVFGPLAVRPDLWDKGVAKRLLTESMETFDKWGNKQVVLFTVAESAKHVGLYQKFGFWPRFLTAIMARPVGSQANTRDWTRYSQGSAAEKSRCLEACREVSASLYEGLDLSGEINSVATQKLGDTLLLWEGGRLSGFAICHWGPGTEAGSGVCFVKFGAVRSGDKAGPAFERLLDACESLAKTMGVQRLVSGVNTARQDAYARMLFHGFRTLGQGVSMHRPNESGYSRADVYALDDWR